MKLLLLVCTKRSCQKIFLLLLGILNPRAKPTLYLIVLQTSNSLLYFLIIYQFLSHLAGITVKLQSSTLDIMAAYQEIGSIKSFYMSLREKISNEFNKVYQQAETMGASINVDPSRPRSCARQRNRPNGTVQILQQIVLKIGIR